MGRAGNLPSPKKEVARQRSKYLRNKQFSCTTRNREYERWQMKRVAHCGKDIPDPSKGNSVGNQAGKSAVQLE
jgi:hypothetical protein